MKVRNRKPYAIVGAGGVAASLWKRGNEADGWSYDFTVFRIDARSGEADQLLKPTHVADLVKLARVLAQVIADDGCVSHSMRKQLNSVASQIDLFCGGEE